MAASLTTTWEGGSSRVRVQLAGAVSAIWATFQVRLVGTTTWTTVRGGHEVALVSGNATVFDYEFPSSDIDPLLLGDDTLLGEDTLPSGSYAEYRAVLSTTATVTDQCLTDLGNQTWLKFPAYPYRNRRVTVVGRGSVSRQGRSSLIPVASSVLGTTVGEFMSGRTMALTVRTETWPAYVELDEALSLGSIVLLHADQARLGLPNCYAVITRVDSQPVGAVRSRARHTDIELAEVGRPHYAYAAAPASLGTLLDNYATFQELFDQYESFGQLLELEGSGVDVVVP